jgi:hypothetical protein
MHPKGLPNGTDRYFASAPAKDPRPEERAWSVGLISCLGFEPAFPYQWHHKLSPYVKRSTIAGQSGHWELGWMIPIQRPVRLQQKRAGAKLLAKNTPLPSTHPAQHPPQFAFPSPHSRLQALERFLVEISATLVLSTFTRRQICTNLECL